MRDDHRGMSILEVITSIGIFGLIMVVITVLQISIFRNSQLARNRSALDQQSLTILRNFTSELRAAQEPSDGSFPLASTTDSTVSFYTDKNGTGVVEKIRYSVESGALKRGVTLPSGQPLTYDPSHEAVTTLTQNVLPQPPYFIYYGTNFNGSTSTPPLAQPVLPSDVRLVEMNLSIDSKTPGQDPRTLETRASIRTLENK